MSRPFSFLLSAVFLASALSFTGCVGTIYDRTYSNKMTYFKPPEDKKEVSADTILKSLDTKPADTSGAAVPGLDSPTGLPPAGLPAPDAGAAPAIPGCPPRQPRLLRRRTDLHRFTAQYLGSNSPGLRGFHRAWILFPSPFGFTGARIVHVDFDFQ